MFLRAMIFPLLAFAVAANRASAQEPSIRRMGPLRPHGMNPRYFADGDGNPVCLTGSHTWANLQDFSATDPPEAFDFAGYLDFLQQHHHNFIRLWRWEPARTTLPQGGVRFAIPHPWARLGPGLAPDGKPKFDLHQFDETYFERLRERVMAARDRGIYVSIMLFEGWALSGTSFDGHPFHVDYNLQGIDGDADKDGKGLEIQMLVTERVTAIQEAYVRKVIDTVNDLHNVLYEISNESRLLAPEVSSKDWQYHFIRFIKQYESNKPFRHPVGMTSQGYGGGDDSALLLDSPADWISPNPDEHAYKTDPPAADGKKVILIDTDHLWGIGGDSDWVWKSFFRGLNPVWMDPYDRAETPWGPRLPEGTADVRIALGLVQTLAARIRLDRLTPHGELASSGYCLADPGHAYVVYLPATHQGITIDLSAAKGSLNAEWLNLADSQFHSAHSVEAGGEITLTPPEFDPKSGAILHLYTHQP